MKAHDRTQGRVHGEPYAVCQKTTHITRRTQAGHWASADTAPAYGSFNAYEPSSTMHICRLYERHSQLRFQHPNTA